MWLLALLAVARAATAEDEIVLALTPRHVDVSCAEVAPEWPRSERVRAFVAVAEGVSAPPWVPIAAASCAAEQADDPVAREAVARWIGDPAWAGLAVASIERFDALSEAVAAPLAEKAVTRGLADARFAAWVRVPLDASAHPAVRRAARRLETDPSRDP